MLRVQSFIALLLSLVLLSACETAPSPPNAAATPAPQAGQSPVAPVTTPGSSSSTAYPAAQGAQEPTAYPPPGAAQAAADALATQTSGPYPPPTATPVQGFAFSFNEPLKKGDTLVGGTGPEGVPIRIVNITRNGEQVATTVIGNDGTFRVEIPTGLTGGDQLGIQIGDLTGTNYKPEQFIVGPGYRDIPQLGIMLARINIEP